VASFTIACDRDFKTGGEKETDWIDCVAWRQTGEFIQKYFAKGRMIVVSGRLQVRSWEDKDGKKRKTAEVVVDNAYFGDSKSATDNNVGHKQNFAPIEEADEGLPF
jgi:single-strand DNA-binding protein